MINKADIQIALDEHKIINSDPRKWASLEIIVHPFRVVRLSVGNRHGSKKEVPYKVIHYSLNQDGKCSIYEGYLG
jgi:hypothetical protein